MEEVNIIHQILLLIVFFGVGYFCYKIIESFFKNLFK